MFRVGLSLIIAGCLMLPVNSFAASKTVFGEIERVLATPADKWGGCLVRTTAKYGVLNCSKLWVSLDCEGAVEGNTKSAGQRRFDLATLAVLTERRVKLRIFDNIKLNGYCYADQVEILPPR